MSARNEEAFRLARRLKEAQGLDKDQANEIYKQLKEAMESLNGLPVDYEQIIEDISGYQSLRNVPKFLKAILSDPKGKYILWDRESGKTSSQEKADEMAQDDKAKWLLEREGENGYEIELARMRGETPQPWKPLRWLEPNFPLDGLSKDDIEFLIANPEYRENTFISVWRESKAKGVPMREICEAKGLEIGSLMC